jgi:AraC family transcriptional regulator
MIRYVSSGQRRFGEMPIGSHSRLNWEFYAVVDGRCGVLLESGEKLPLKTQCLWVFPPHHTHGWHGEHQHCNVMVVHCSSVPRQLMEAIPAEGYLERELTEDESEHVIAIGRTLEDDFHGKSPLSELRFDRSIIDLALIALNGVPVHGIHGASRRMSEKVEAAVAWFRRHVREQPTMDQVASAVHVSPSHLRRLFTTVLKQNPRAVLGNAQIEIAMRLLSGSDLKIESVAAESGFASARDFSRVFSAHLGCSPSDWRRRSQEPIVPHAASSVA